MPVEDWARRKGEEVTGYDSPERESFAQGVIHALSALLSDKAVEAAAVAAHKTEYKRAGIRAPWWSMPDWLKARYRETARAALQAAIAAVTEGDAE